MRSFCAIVAAGEKARREVGDLGANARIEERSIVAAIGEGEGEGEIFK